MNWEIYKKRHHFAVVSLFDYLSEPISDIDFETASFVDYIV